MRKLVDLLLPGLRRARCLEAEASRGVAARDARNQQLDQRAERLLWLQRGRTGNLIEDAVWNGPRRGPHP